MHRHTSSSSLLALIVFAGLGSAQSSARAAEPRSTTDTGMIEMAVAGAGDNVRFFIDGKQVAPRKRTVSWHPYVAAVDVPGGEHVAEAQFRIAGRDNDEEWQKVTTRQPVMVTPGSVTRLYANAKHSGSTESVLYFEDHSPQSTSRAATSRVITPAPSPGVPVATQETADAAKEAAQESEPSTIAAPSAATGSGAVESSPGGEAAAVPTIAIHGTEVLSNGRDAAPQPTPAATDPLDVNTVGLPNDAPKVSEVAPPPDDTPLVQPSRIEIAFLVKSVPSGAEVALDGKLVGKTPLHVQLDPRVDHLIAVGHEGCESVVQLLATDAWRAGRSAQTLVNLDCKQPDWESKKPRVEKK